MYKHISSTHHIVQAYLHAYRWEMTNEVRYINNIILPILFDARDSYSHDPPYILSTEFDSDATNTSDAPHSHISTLFVTDVRWDIEYITSIWLAQTP